MFSKDKESGRVVCIEGYGRINRGAIVPVTNELYADVQQWIDEGNALGEFNGYPAEPEKDAHSRIITIDSALLPLDQRHGDRAVREFMLTTDLPAPARERIETAEAEAADLRTERATLVSEYGEPDRKEV